MDYERTLLQAGKVTTNLEPRLTGTKNGHAAYLLESKQTNRATQTKEGRLQCPHLHTHRS